MRSRGKGDAIPLRAFQDARPVGGVIHSEQTRFVLLSNLAPAPFALHVAIVQFPACAELKSY